MSHRPLIYKVAQIRLVQIWDYTFEKWGKDQADKYLRELGSIIQKIAEERHLWRSVKDSRLPDIFFIKGGHHFIFFKEINEQIAVISILHENMDLLQRLREDNQSSV